jgi:PAS domain S-box-containing protein
LPLQVIPAKERIQYFQSVMDSTLRGNDGLGRVSIHKNIPFRCFAITSTDKNFTEKLIANAPNPIFVAGPDTRILYANPALLELTGYPVEEAAGCPAPYPWWPPEKTEHITGIFRHVFFNGGQSVERHFRKKNGADFYVEITPSPSSKTALFHISFQAGLKPRRARRSGRVFPKAANAAGIFSEGFPPASTGQRRKGGLRTRTLPWRAFRGVPHGRPFCLFPPGTCTRTPKTEGA